MNSGAKIAEPCASCRRKCRLGCTSERPCLAVSDHQACSATCRPGASFDTHLLNQRVLQEVAARKHPTRPTPDADWPLPTLAVSYGPSRATWFDAYGAVGVCAGCFRTLRSPRLHGRFRGMSWRGGRWRPHAVHVQGQLAAGRSWRSTLSPSPAALSTRPGGVVLMRRMQWV